MVQLNLNLTKHTCIMYLTGKVFHFTHVYVCVCACETDDVEALVQSTHVHTRHLHDILHEHACMSVMYTSNLTSLYAH